MTSHRPCQGIPLIAFLFTSLLCGKAEPKILGEIKLQADITSGKKAIPQVQAAFGKYSIESPELFEGNHRDFEHLTVEKDKEMGASFVFYLHRDKDGDRDKAWPNGMERQRNEIKGYQSSPATLKAVRGEVTRYHWYLKIDESFTITKSFCHFFQLKPVKGKNSSDPLVTLSGSIVRGKPQLELRWWSKDGSDRISVADWEDSRGKWLECECISRLDEKGTIRFSVRSTDGAIRFGHELKNFNSWRPGSSFVRPKWGIYRSLVNKKEIANGEDQVRMSKITIQKLSRLP
jgi:hypothetical protein